MKKLALTSAMLMFSASSVLAQQSGGFGSQAKGVPEISALEGTAAIAALAAIVLLAWERRRRASC